MVGLILALAYVGARAVEPTWNYAVQISARVQSDPAQIELTWPADTTEVPTSCTVFRKEAGTTGWGPGTALAGNAVQFVDTTAVPGLAYEYQVERATSTYLAFGYVQAGIAVPFVENRGKVILIVDATHASALAGELGRLQQDLVGDGWTVLRRDVDRAASPAHVKALIQADYVADPAGVKCVFLFGRIPVPYSGRMAPDGHSEHMGAWPADVYYGDMSGSWTDTSVNYLQSRNSDPAERARLSNIPGDGKFDQAGIPAEIRLQVGRVDFANMPGRVAGVATFAPETELLRQYLDKDHNFRHRITRVERRAVIGDYFGITGGSAFAASGYRSFAPLAGSENILNLNSQYGDAGGVWIPTLAANDYLLAYGCGPGTFQSIGGIGTSTEMVTNRIRAVFTLVFGSWLGDWDSTDNIMRAILAAPGYSLAAAWSGRPHWFLHPMGLGETIGYCARLTQNNERAEYQSQINSSAGMVHVALMGDPTLRLLPVAPATSLNGVLTTAGLDLSWSGSADPALGYHVYRASAPAGPFTRITQAPVTELRLRETSPVNGTTYMVRAVKLETTPSGTYYNASQGAFWTTSGVPAADTTAPVVVVTTPASGATVAGSAVVIAVDATDNFGVAGVQIQIDGTTLGTGLRAAPHALEWDSTSLANGWHEIVAIAYDAAGNLAVSTSVRVNVANLATPPPRTANFVWIDDSLPDGATPMSYGGDGWTWVTGAPQPFSGTVAHQSAAKRHFHEHGFYHTPNPMTVAAGDTLFTYIHLDPANPPAEIMLTWITDDGTVHRAYWGADKIRYGKNNTASRRRMGPLPRTGQWELLDVPASMVDLEGKVVTGMTFSLYGGRATWDYTGKIVAQP